MVGNNAQPVAHPNLGVGDLVLRLVVAEIGTGEYQPEECLLHFGGCLTPSRSKQSGVLVLEAMIVKNAPVDDAFGCELAAA